jgi:hypothetical protein
VTISVNVYWSREEVAPLWNTGSPRMDANPTTNAVLSERGGSPRLRQQGTLKEAWRAQRTLLLPIVDRPGAFPAPHIRLSLKQGSTGAMFCWEGRSVRQVCLRGMK